MAKSQAEVIDLTTPPPESAPPEIIVLDSDEPNAAQLQTSGQGVDASPDKEKKRSVKRKRSKRKSLVDTESTRPSREQSRERGGSKHQKRNGEYSNGNSEDKDRNLSTRTRRSRSRSPVPRRKTHRGARSPSLPRTPATDFFFIDVKPVPLPPTQPATAAETDLAEQNRKLLLPEHVSVHGNAPIEILPPLDLDTDEEDYIEYLDYDTRPGLVRYYDVQPDDENDEKKGVPTKTVCKNCGAEGKHLTWECPVIICLTCGARDEHLTRSCPISKTCFNCGMKGHINSACPNPRLNHYANSGEYNDCDRCGSRGHKTNECPSLWRLYEYLTDDQRDATLRNRIEKSKLTLGQGGEGYIATDEWCYNCGGSGHWGDDCMDLPHPYDRPNEPSCFSAYNTRSGPFFDPTADSTPSTSHRRELREWEREGGPGLPEGWGDNAPENVGKKGRRKEVQKMERRAKEQQTDDDPDDWFGNPKNLRIRGAAAPVASGYSQRQGGGGGNGPKKITFGSSIRDAGRQFQPVVSAGLPNRPAASTREEERVGSRGKYAYDPTRAHRPLPSVDLNNNNFNNNQRNGGGREREHNKTRDRDRDRDRDRNRDRNRRDDPGPRYKGGYSR